MNITNENEWILCRFMPVHYCLCERLHFFHGLLDFLVSASEHYQLKKYKSFHYWYEYTPFDPNAYYVQYYIYNTHASELLTLFW